MMSQTAWAGLTVRSFFQDYNWLGQSSQGRWDEPTEEVEAPCLLELTVSEFFRRGNWQGKASAPQATSPGARPVPRALSVTSSVAEFFGGIVWGGTAAIAPVATQPAKPAFLEDITPPDDLNLNRLSDLF